MEVKLEGDTLIITVPLKEGVESKNGKSYIRYMSDNFEWQDGIEPVLGIRLVVIEPKNPRKQ